jgi:maltooligosyltrehalose trehalohydrolase
MIDLNEVGAFASAPTSAGVDVRFSVYLPEIEAANGYEVRVRVIHKDDRFVPQIKPLDFSLAPGAGQPDTYWQAKVTIPFKPGTKFGQPGTYLYRYQLWKNGNLLTRWFTDPFARATDVGELSAFVTPGFVPDFVWTDDAWKVPELEDLVVYELHVEEFNSTFDGVIERLPYLKSLGVTCLELLPVSSLKLDFDWGYGPLHYFAPNERWGGVHGLKRLVNACHLEGVAVIFDVVYQHVDEIFPYNLVYQNAGIPSPMINGTGPFGPQIDFSKAFAREYVQTANFHWLYEYHVDGFRYDEVTDLYDGPEGVKYAKIAFDTYNESLKIARFTPSGGVAPREYSRIIQCPEALNRPQEILRDTYSNSTWQDGLLNKAEDMAQKGYVDDDFVHLLDPRFIGYPDSKTVHDIAGQPVEMPVAPFQYLESHDHSQLICFVGELPGDVPFGDRSRYYKLQPFAIALYTSQGTPMLWQGQEFAENYYLPDQGNGRICFRRDVHWEHFYDDFGVPLVRLYRILGTLRQTCPALRSQESFYYNAQSRPRDGVVAYRRQSTAAEQIAMVFLNFSDEEQSIAVPFPEPGIYREMIDEDIRSTPLEISVSSPNQFMTVDVPSHYGYIFVK